MAPPCWSRSKHAASSRGGLVGVAEAGEAAGLVQQVAHGDVRATGPVDVVAERVVEVEVHGVVAASGTRAAATKDLVMLAT